MPEIEREGRSILFTDVDGVLNGHERFSNGYCGTRSDCVLLFNEVLLATNCLIVVSSAWRYLVHNGFMTVAGLENLYLTHGLNCQGRVVGVTRKDVTPTVTDRGRQIREWLDEFGDGIRSYAVVDDLEFDITDYHHPFVRTDKDLGITAANAVMLCGLLGATLQPDSDTSGRKQWNR